MTYAHGSIRWQLVSEASDEPRWLLSLRLWPLRTYRGTREFYPQADFRTKPGHYSGSLWFERFSNCPL
jgi:hypothetical protein